MKKVELPLQVTPDLDAKAVNGLVARLKALLQGVGKGTKIIDAGQVNAAAAQVAKGTSRMRDEFARFGKVGVDAGRNVAASLRDVQTQATGISGKLGGLGGLLKGGAFVAAGAGVVGLGKAMISGNADMESYMTQFEVLTGSVENATKLFGDMKTMGMRTPFETGDLAKASQTMLSFGVAQDKIIPNLQMLGDISGGNAEKLQSLSLVFSQVSANGKLMGGDLLQMINAGFNPLKIIQEQTGKSMAQLRQEMENGQITFDMVAGAMKTATSEGGQFFGMMDKQSQTFSGMMSTLKDVAGEAVRSLGGPLFDEAKKALSGLITLLQSPQIQEAISGLGKALGPLIGALAGALQTLLPVVLEVFGVFAQALGPVASALGGIITPIAGILGTTLKALQPILGMIIGALTKVLGVVGKVLDQMAGPLGQIIGIIGKLIGEVIAPRLELIVEVVSALLPALVPIIEVIAALLDALMPLIELALQPTILLFKGLAWAVKNVVGPVLTWIGGLFKALVGPIKEAGEWIKGAAQDVADFFSGLFGGMTAAERRAKEAAEKQRKDAENRTRQQIQAFGQEQIDRARRIQEQAEKVKAEAEEKARKKKEARAQKGSKDSQTALQAVQKLADQERRRQEIADRQASVAREAVRLQAGRKKDSADELLTEQGKLGILTAQRDLLRDKLLNADGSITIKLDAKKGETEETVRQMIDEADIAVGEQQNRIRELRLQVVPQIDEARLAELSEERLRLDVELGTKTNVDLAAFIEGDVGRLRADLATYVADRTATLERAKVQGIITETEFNQAIADLQAGREEHIIEAENRIAARQKEARDLRYQTELDDLERAQARQEKSIQAAQDRQARFVESFYRLLERGGGSAITASKDKALKELDQAKDAELISAEAYEARKAEIAAEAADQQQQLEDRLRGARLEAERQAAVESLAIEQKRLQDKLAIAERYGDTKEADNIRLQLDDVGAAIKDKGAALTGVSQDLQENLTNVFTNLMTGDEEGVKAPFKRMFSVLAGALSKLASAKVTEVLLSSIGPTGIGGLIAAIGAKPMIENIIGAIIGPLLASILSFSSGGRVDSPTLIWAGDASNARPGSDSEWIFRDDQIRELLNEVVAASQMILVAEMRAQTAVLQTIAEKEYRLSGTDLVQSADRTRQASARRAMGRRAA